MIDSTTGRSSTPAVLRRSAAMCAAALTVATVLTACGGSSGSEGGKEKEVASLEEGAKKGPGTAKTADPEEGRPRLRLDSTEAEWTQLYNAYYSCLKTNGGKVEEVTGPKSGGTFTLDADLEKQPPTALKACEKKEPVTPPERDPNKNPDYADVELAWVKCINDRGLKVNATSDGWTYDRSVSEDEKSSPQNEKIVRDCEIEAFKD
ncbi:hypothetical protein ACFYWY_34325 [Streptomyces sp. NPDC002870]|uniref:hypothetical protein n=1 Tax=Streptomyces sp. NPDC002870 TaxID=3364666 RepID=UPI0036CE1C8C